jgi:two-component system, response regulator PdtaR
LRNACVLLFPARRGPEREGGEAAGHGPADGLFKGLKILVVEDDFIVAFDMQTLLEEQGAHVLGPAASLREAQALLATEVPQAAVLDVNLNGEFVFPLAELLRAKGVPFLFATAYADDDRLFPPASKQAPRLAKPVLPAVLVTQLKKLLG